VDSSRVSFGETIAGVSAGLLFIFMFLPWYGASAVVGGNKINGENADAWQAFSLVDVLLFLAILVTLAVVVARAVDSIPPNLPAPPGMIIVAAGAVAVILILFRLILTPGEDVVGFGVHVDVGRKFGAFLGLIAAAAMTYGGWTAAHERNERPEGSAES
jgi:hypothetical protein